MTDAELTARLRDNLRGYKALQAHGGPLRMLDLPGVCAFALPLPGAPLFQQQVLYAEAHALAEALMPLEAWYRELGVQAWRVNVYPGDATAEAVLARAGHRPEGSSPAMSIALSHLPPQLPPGTTLEHPEGLEDVMKLNGLCYGQEHVGYFETWRPQLSTQLHAVLVRQGGRALAGGVSFEQGDTAGIYLVATHPEARRRGLGALVMQALHADARARGCGVAVLQSSLLGYDLYQSLGYRDLGAWTSWVRRAS
ncbi:GNAT family N-acetyltransferase [Archangium lansingense]|uniref:GNAT family N-acetyltransferase n=1 Tax=Archangium lansingense TaxID=2995310 RepID=A0ABT3ZW07_9BACT|nr:GNAT family N-acetyltransferase [Archangium lansinium]MCY1073249.1 GNAT family N-acetyltransferase [Archangium lansinium]